MTEPKQTVECLILAPVLNLAAARAAQQDRELTVVARAVLVKASRLAHPSDDGVAHPAERPPRADCKRIRFRMPKDEHAVVKDRIRASGQSMTSALEQGLMNYAKTGEY